MTRLALALLIALTGCAVQPLSPTSATGDSIEAGQVLRDLTPAGLSGSAGHASDAPQVTGLAARVRDRELCPGISSPPDILCHDYPKLHVGSVRLTVSTDRHPGEIAYRVYRGGTLIGESQHWTAPAGSRGTQLLVAPCPGCGDGTASLILGWTDASGAMAWGTWGRAIAGSPAPPAPEPEPEPQPDDGPRATVERRVGGWWVEVVEGLLRGEGFVPSTRSTPQNNTVLKGGE